MPRPRSPRKLTCLNAVKNWIQHLEPAHAARKPITRLVKAIDCLDAPSSREARADLQKVMKDWGIQQKHEGKKRPLAEVKEDLMNNIIREAKQLQPIQGVSPIWSVFSNNATR